MLLRSYEHEKTSTKGYTTATSYALLDYGAANVVHKATCATEWQSWSRLLRS